MASEYDKAKKELENLKNTISQIKDGKVVYLVKDPDRGNVFFEQKAFLELVANAELKVKNLAPKGNLNPTSFGPQTKTYPDTPAGKLEQQKDTVLIQLANEQKRLDNPITSKFNKNDIVQNINKLNNQLVEIEAALIKAGGPTATTSTTVPATTTTTPATTGATTTKPVVTTTGAGSTVKVYTPEEVAALLKPVPVVTGTGSGKGSKGGKGGKGGKGAVVADTPWEPLFKQNYPQYSWMFTDLDRTKYADVFTLFSKAIDPKTGKQIMTDEEFDRRYIGTSFYRELETSQKGRELSTAIGNFSWGSGNLAKFLTKAIQFGYKEENLKQQAYTELFSKVGDNYVNDLAVKEVRASSPYLALKRIGTQYLTSFNDKTVEDALSGGMTADDLLRKSRELAKAMYPHLKDSIDAGVTLEDLSANYKQIAARTLELDPSQVDMGLKFNEALNYTKDGAPRMLSLAEWETELRTNDKYKYSFTKQANQDATDIGLSIARAFGKVE